MKLARSSPGKIGFIISTYKRPDLMVRLVNSLDGRPCSIHVDKRSPILQELQQALQNCANVTFLKQHRVYWGDFGHVAASLEGLRWFRATSLDYAILLTGQCYPLVPIGDIENYLGELGGKSLIQHEAFLLPSRWHRVEFDRLLARLPFRLRGRLDDSCDYVPSTKPSYWGDCGLARIYSYHLFFRGRWMRVPFLVRNLPLQLHPYGGSSYWCLSRKCVDYILNFCDENPEIISFFKKVYIPCEAFFQTILGNSHLCSELINEEIHYLEWENPNNSPNILNSAEKALASGKWFARKFESNDVLDEIDRQVAYCAR